jgi:mRNA interferase RelE/StbE
MVEYAKDILKDVKSGKVPHRTFLQIHHCFEAMEKVGDMTIFDVKPIKGDFERNYFRLRKGRYKAIFFFDHGNIKVIALEHRSEVYRQWP